MDNSIQKFEEDGKKQNTGKSTFRRSMKDDISTSARCTEYNKTLIGGNNDRSIENVTTIMDMCKIDSPASSKE
jgi:hypothetical protein